MYWPRPVGGMPKIDFGAMFLSGQLIGALNKPMYFLRALTLQMRWRTLCVLIGPGP
jgi:hypothetical protein